MGRSIGAVSRSHVRIVDHAAFAAVVSALVARGVEGITGVRALARAIGIPAPRLSEWMQGRRHGLPREHFQSLQDAVIFATGGDHAVPDGIEALFASVAPPADGGGLWPEPQRPKTKSHRHTTAFFEDIVGATAAARIERGQPVGPDSPFWTEAVTDRPLYVTPRLFTVLTQRLSLPPAYECDEDGLPTAFSTDRGERYRVWFTVPLDRSASPSSRRARKPK